MPPNKDSRSCGSCGNFRRVLERADGGLRDEEGVLRVPGFLLEVRFFLRVIGMESL
jgi:hypothetical protein